MNVPLQLVQFTEHISLLITTTRHKIWKAQNQIHFNNIDSKPHKTIVSIKQAFRCRLTRERRLDVSVFENILSQIVTAVWISCKYLHNVDVYAQFSWFKPWVGCSDVIPFIVHEARV